MVRTFSIFKNWTIFTMSGKDNFSLLLIDIVLFMFYDGLEKKELKPERALKHFPFRFKAI